MNNLQYLKIETIHRDHRYRVDFGDIEGLTESIREKGVLQPITVSPEMRLLAGERRIRAAIAAGLTEIPALIRSVEGELDAREIELFENIWRKDFNWPERCALVAEIDRLYKEKQQDWSARKTAQLLDRGVASVSRDLKLAKAIEAVPELAQHKTADDALKVIAKVEEDAIVEELARRQQVRIHSSNDLAHGTNASTAIAQHRDAISTVLRYANSNYMIGDAFVGMAELRSDGVVHLIECDPPYGIDLPAVKRGKDSIVNITDTYNEIPQDTYPAFLAKLARELYRVAGKNCWLVFWFGPTWFAEVKAALTAAGWRVDDIPAVWIKRQGQTLQPEKYLARGYEPFFLARKGEPLLAKRGRLNVFDFPVVPTGAKYHPTQRPVALIQDILETLAHPTNIVLCPFLGSGATIRAAYNAGMLVFGWDISDEYKKRLLLAVEEDTRKLMQTSDSPADDDVDLDAEDEEPETDELLEDDDEE